jgi:hypothetical protein
MNNDIDTTIGLIDVGGDKTRWLLNFKNNLSSLSNERLIEIAASWASEAEFQQQQRLKLTKRFNSITGGKPFLYNFLTGKGETSLLDIASALENDFENYVLGAILRKADAQNKRKVAAGGGKAKAARVEKCRIEFIRMVDERTPAWNKTKEGLAEAILELKPAIVKYAKDKQYSAITASTRLPERWLREHWNLEKRAYKKTVTK